MCDLPGKVGVDELPVITRRCGHLFGEVCVKKWLAGEEAVGCPTCRRTFESVPMLLAEKIKDKDPLWWLKMLKGEQ